MLAASSKHRPRVIRARCYRSLGIGNERCSRHRRHAGRNVHEIYRDYIVRVLTSVDRIVYGVIACTITPQGHLRRILNPTYMCLGRACTIPPERLHTRSDANGPSTVASLRTTYGPISSSKRSTCATGCSAQSTLDHASGLFWMPMSPCPCGVPGACGAFRDVSVGCETGRICEIQYIQVANILLPKQSTSTWYRTGVENGARIGCCSLYMTAAARALQAVPIFLLPPSRFA